MRWLPDFIEGLALAGAAVSLAAWLVLAYGRWLLFAAYALAKVPRSRLAAFLAFVLVATVVAQKPQGTNSPPQGASLPSGENMESRIGNEELPGRSAPGAAQGITNLCFTAICMSSNSVSLSLAWPTNLFTIGTCLDVFEKAWSLTTRWEWIGAADVQPPATNLEVEVLYSQFAPAATNMPFAAFFRVSDRASCAASMSDSDGDGIPDVYELHNGTNPYVPDSALVPKLTVGVGGDYQTVAAALAASTNYSIVALAAGEHVLSDSLMMPAYPVMLTGPEDGYAVLRSSAAIGAVMLVGGQDEETMFKNLHVVLDARQSFQAGFWIGGNLPWSGIGASPSFENVRVRAPHPGALYFGWHYYCDNGVSSLLTNCVMNAAGATDVVGVYSYGGPDVVVSDCHFVNFPATNGNYATHFQNGTNIVAKYAALEAGISWAGYPTDCYYSETVDSDEDGLSNHDEIFVSDTDPWLPDSDGDGVPDGEEVLDGTDPHDLYSFVRHAMAVIRASDSLVNVTNYVAWGTNINGWATNDLAALPSSPAINTFVFAQTVDMVYVKAYRDINRNGTYDPDSDELQSFLVAGNSATIEFTFSESDRDGDGIMDWWETLHVDAGLSPTNAADAYIDLDGDGLVNLHEYWADCNPFVYDGTNTVLSAMAQSVDDRLVNTMCSCFYVNYNQSGVLNGLVKNPSNWAHDVDLSCVSPWNGWHANYEAGVLITRRHVLFAKHYIFQHGEGNRQIYFRPKSGGVYSASVIATNASLHTDIAVALLSEDVPETISSAFILPSDYADYISSGNGLPMLTLDFQEKTLVHDVVSFPSSAGNISAKYPVNPLRIVHAEPIVVGDSGNPRFLLVDTIPILVSTLWTGPNSPATGPFLTTWKSEIQALVDELSCGAGLSTNLYRLTEFDLSQYTKLPEERR